MSTYEKWILDDADYQAIFSPPRRRKQANLRGFDNPSTKLSPADIVAIRSEYNEGRKVEAIARKYNIAKSSVSRIGLNQQQGWVK